MMQFELQTRRVGETRSGGVDPHLHWRVQCGDGPFRDHVKAVRTRARIGVGFHAGRANRVVPLELEIDDQTNVISRMKPGIVSYFRAIPAVAFRDAIAVEGGHLVGFVATAIIDGLADVIGRFADVGDHPCGGVCIGFGWREGRDVIALARPLRRGGGCGGPTLVHAKREVVILVDRRIGGGDGDVAEDLLKEGDPAGNKAYVQVQFTSNG